MHIITLLVLCVLLESLFLSHLKDFIYLKYLFLSGMEYYPCAYSWKRVLSFFEIYLILFMSEQLQTNNLHSKEAKVSRCVHDKLKEKCLLLVCFVYKYSLRCCVDSYNIMIPLKCKFLSILYQKRVILTCCLVLSLLYFCCERLFQYI